MNTQEVWLVGAGQMAIDYAKVLDAQKVPYTTIGRGTDSAHRFEEKTGHAIVTGGLEKYLEQNTSCPANAIVAVNIEELTAVTKQLVKHGVSRILLEKPAGLDRNDILGAVQEAEQSGAEVYVAYNRRFYASTLASEEIIAKDGGIVSFSFEFTEWSHSIEKLNLKQAELEAWFLANSTHVIDLAFYLGGIPKEINCYTAGGLSWYPNASIFSGAGISENGSLFSYQANWKSPGRWGLEVLTAAHRLIFRPMEQLHIQKIGSVAIEKADIDDSLDTRFKPGLYLETKAFLSNETDRLLNIKQHLRNLDWYEKIERGEHKV
jgi:predicted dehydrogenase